MLSSSDYNLYDESDFANDQGADEDINKQQQRIEKARAQKNKRAAQKQAK
jgi:hypothetical protein